MFQGSSALSLDAKGRMTVPARHRDALLAHCDGQLTLTRHPDGCLLMFPRPLWESHRARIAALPIAARAWQRIFLGSAVDVELDGVARILVSPELRNAAGLNREVMLLGMGSHFEIWNPESLKAKEGEAIAAGFPDALADFTF
ncbi:MAG: division/cell wall cluster transcriptional repressor MraZ [Burkholderiales bacterium]|nr:MAG: division/cell wall cluster transcriptional repressor MraZ [Burkholderiales bacterium]